MDIKRCTKESFSVIGKEGSTSDGDGFIQKLWENANGHYNEIESFAKKDDNGNPVGFWGAMSDLSRQFKPWESFSKGLFLPALKLMMTLKRLTGGRNGLFLHTNFFM